MWKKTDKDTRKTHCIKNVKPHWHGYAVPSRHPPNHTKVDEYTESGKEFDCTLKISGEVEVMLDNTGLPSDSRNKGVVVVAWFNTKPGDLVMTRCKEKTKGKLYEYELEVPIPAENPSEVLKIEARVDWTDEESMKRKLVPLQTCGIHVNDLASKGWVNELLHDQFNESLQTKITVKCHSEHLPLHKFQESALRYAEEYNRGLEELTVKIMKSLEDNHMRPPESAKGFVEGLTYAPFIGMPSSGIPSLRNHYALLGTHLNSLDRPLPQEIPCYFLNTVLQQSPYTVRELEQEMEGPGLDSKKLGRVIATVFTGFTRDASMVSYQRDETFTQGVSLGPTGFCMGTCTQTSEDMDYMMHDPGMFLMAENKFEDCKLPCMSKVKTLEEVKKIFRGEHLSAKAQDDTSSKRVRNMYPHTMRSLGYDDCESSTMAACLVANTVLKADWEDERALLAKLKQHRVFQQLTPKCCEFIGKFFRFVQAGMKSGNIQVAPVVGLAGGASAENTAGKGGGNSQSAESSAREEDMMSPADMLEENGGGGHCFGIYKQFSDKSNRVFAMIIEGTNAADMILEEDMFQVQARINTKISEHFKGLKGKGSESKSGPDSDSGSGSDSDWDSGSDSDKESPTNSALHITSLAVPVSSLSSSDGQENKQDYVWKTLTFCEFASLASKTLLEETRVCNAELGQSYENTFGFNSEFDNVTETRAPITMNAQDPLFYRAIAHIDAALDNSTYGYIPSSNLKFKDGKTLSMCIPKDMCSPDLKGMPVSTSMLPLDVKEKGDKIWNEIFKPIASNQKFKDVMAHWGVCQPFHKINQDIPGISDGKRYMTFSCYSSPLARELVEPEGKAWEILAQEVNRLQREDPSSDGVYLKHTQQGTGNTLTAYMPVQDNLKVTFFHSLAQAKKNLGWHDE